MGGGGGGRSGRDSVLQEVHGGRAALGLTGVGHCMLGNTWAPPPPHSPVRKRWGWLQAPRRVAVSARTCTLWAVPARRPASVAWVSVAFTGSSAGGGSRGPRDPVTPGGGARAAGCPWSTLGCHTGGRGAAERRAGLPLKHRHRELRASAPAALGQSRPESRYRALLGTKAPRGRGGARGHNARQDSAQPLAPAGPGCPHTGHLGAVLVPTADHVRLQDARAGAQRRRHPGHRHPVRADLLHPNLLRAPSLRGCNQRQGHGQRQSPPAPPPPQAQVTVAAGPGSTSGHGRAPSLSSVLLSIN